jgi:L,D-transpeptidase ErfK/SrfK
VPQRWALQRCLWWRARVAALAICIFALWVTLAAHSEELALPENPSDNLIGELRYTRARPGETLLDLARFFDLGHDQIILTNPGINRWLPPPSASITIASRYLLPPGPRRGIVINLAELRLYYYQLNRGLVLTFPISIGDMDWRTPLGITHITAKMQNPSWTPPKSIREEHAREGEELPQTIPGGDPDNPLGEFALSLARKGYLIHGTDERRAFGIGMRVSHGCIRLYPEDIRTLFSVVPVGTPVRIVNEPIKAGWHEDLLFLEIHRPLESEELDAESEPTADGLFAALERLLKDSDQIDSYAVKQAFLIGDGIPIAVANRKKSGGPHAFNTLKPLTIGPKLMP